MGCAGDNFSYKEVQEASGPVMAALGTLALAIGFAALRFMRSLVLRLLPKPGEGPSKEMQVCVARVARQFQTHRPALHGPVPGGPCVVQVFKAVWWVAQLTGFWRARVLGVPEARAGEAAAAPVIAELGDKRDPGYWSTARMVLEAGLTLALEAGASALCHALCPLCCLKA